MELVCIALLSSLLLLTLMVYNLYTNRNSVKYMENVPIPPSNSWLGNLGEFLSIPTHEFLEKFIEKSKYGSLILFKLAFIPPLLLVSSEKFTKYVFNSTKHISKPDQYSYFHNWMGNGVFTANGNEWRHRRRTITPAFHFSSMEQFVDIFEKHGDLLIEKLGKLVGKQSIDVHELITLYSLDNILEACLGPSINAQNNDKRNYAQMITVMCYIVIRRTFSPLPNILYPFSSLYYKEKRACKVIHAIIEDAIERKFKNLSAEDKNDVTRKFSFLDFLIQGNNMSKTEIRDEINTIIFGVGLDKLNYKDDGYDTLASTISFVLYALANHPEIQKKVLEEQILIFGDIENVVNPSSKFKVMKYLEVVIKETLRLYATTPIIGRKLAEDFEFEGNVFPKGLNCGFLFYCMNLNPDNFPEPRKFIPERFLEKNGKNNFACLMPFSAGPRSCIGQKFAWLEMKSGISKIIRNFELHPANPNPPLQLAPETVLVSINGINISIKRRQTKI